MLVQMRCRHDRLGGRGDHSGFAAATAVVVVVVVGIDVFFNLLPSF